jgi:hypothetical protein
MLDVARLGVVSSRAFGIEWSPSSWPRSSGVEKPRTANCRVAEDDHVFSFPDPSGVNTAAATATSLRTQTTPRLQVGRLEEPGDGVGEP